ncbi:MAG: hypothetical protein WD602_00860 [Actinomycetota bacterium]
MISPRLTRTAALPAVGLAGLLAGHRLTYLHLDPTGEVLAATGHGYLGPAGVTAAVLAAMAGVFWLSLGSMRRRQLDPPVMALLATLSIIQVLGFGLQEILERALVGAPMTGLMPVFLLGIPVQLAVAVLATLLAVGLYKAGGKLARLLSSPRPRTAASPVAIFAAGDVEYTAPIPGGRCTRGPPVRSVYT